MLRSILASPKLERSKLKEYLIRLMYVECGARRVVRYIHAVKATHEPDLAFKRVGYLATSARSTRITTSSSSSSTRCSKI